MPRYVALLRGINVGGHRIKMDRLRELFVELDLADVTTFIASGNVIFSVGSGSVKRLEATHERYEDFALRMAEAALIISYHDSFTNKRPARAANRGHRWPSRPRLRAARSRR